MGYIQTEHQLTDYSVEAGHVTPSDQLKSLTSSAPEVYKYTGIPYSLFSLGSFGCNNTLVEPLAKQTQSVFFL